MLPSATPWGALAALALAQLAALLVPLWVRFWLDATHGALRPAHALAPLALVALAAGLGALAQARLQRAADAAHAALRRRVFRKLLTVGLRFHQGRPLGETLALLENDTAAARSLLTAVLPGLVALAVQLVGLAALLPLLAPRLALVALLPAPVALALAWRLRARQQRVAGAAQAAAGALLGLQAEALGAVRTLAVYDGVEKLAPRFDRANEAYARAVTERDRAARSFGAVGTGAGLLAVFVLALVARPLWLAGALSPGTAVALAVYALRAAGPLRAVPGLLLAWSAARAAQERLRAVLAAPDEPAAPPSPRPLARATGALALRFEAVRFAYRDARGGGAHQALDGVSLELARGARVAVLGPSGAGKSTLGMLVPRLFDPDEGRVYLDDVPATELDPRALRSRVGYLEQDPVLFDDSFRANIALGLDEAFARSEDGARALERAVRVARVGEVLERRGASLDARVFERGANLSGGQRKRVALARALAREPGLLVVDQLASDLENALNEAIFTALRTEYDTTVLYLGHRVPPGLEPTAVYWMEGGALRRLDAGAAP